MSTIAVLLHETKSLENSSSMHSVITNFRSIEQFSYDLEKWFRLSVRYLFYQRSKHGLFVFPLKKTLMWRRHCSIGQSCCSMTSKRSIGWFLGSSPTWSFFTRFYQPKAMLVCIRSINQSSRSISVCLLFLFCSRVFISRSYENRSQKTVNVYTADVTHLKGRRHAICYLFERDKQSPRLNWFPKIMVQFCFSFFRLYDGFRHWKRFFLLLQRVGKDEPTFSSFNAIHQKLLWLIGSLMKFVWYLLYNSTGTFLCMAKGTK